MNKDSEIVYLILARFSLKNNIFRTHLYKDWSEKDWTIFLDERKRVFIEYNLPSLKSQTNKDFDYLVYIDPTFPAINAVLDGMKDAEKNNNLVKLQYVNFPWGDGDPNCPFTKPLKFHVFNYIENNYPNCKWLITTRLDTDDLLARDFIQETYNIFRNGESWRRRKQEHWISFEHGYCYLKTKNIFIQYTDWASCHVIFCEPFHNDKKYVETVFHRTHSKLGFTREHTDKITVIYSPERGWWLDLIGLNTNLARHNKYLGTDRAERLWRRPNVPIEKIKKYIEFRDLREI